MKRTEIDNYIEYIESIIRRRIYSNNDIEKLNKMKDMFHLMKYLYVLDKYRASLLMLKEITNISDTLDSEILRKEIYTGTNNLFFSIKSHI